VIGPLLLLLLTFLVGTGFTFYLPAQQASVNDFVSREQLPQAVSLGAVAFNLARAIGPALAGALAACLSSGSTLVATAFFFVPMFLVTWFWKRQEGSLPGVPERLLSGVMAGMRYARHSAAMRALIVRNLSFSLCASAFWALLPVVARDELQLQAGGFGLLSASFGAGAILGAVSIPIQLRRLSMNRVVTYVAVLLACPLLILALTRSTALALLACAFGGMAWVYVFATLVAGTQTSAPGWVRARALSMNLVATQGSLAAGSALWGILASVTGIRIALASAAVLVI